MSDNKANNESYQIRNTIQAGLKNIPDTTNWLNEYKIWAKKESHEFYSLLEIADPFNIKCTGNSYIFNLSDFKQVHDLDILCMSIFLSDYLHYSSIQTFNKVKKEQNPTLKINIINDYFNIVNYIKNFPNFSYCIVTLNTVAERQMVLKGKTEIDLYKSFLLFKNY